MFHMPSGGHRMSSPVTITDYFKIVNQLVINVSCYEGIQAWSLYIRVCSFWMPPVVFFSVLNCNCVSWLCIRNLWYHVTTLHVGLIYIFTRVSRYIYKTSCLFCSQHPFPPLYVTTWTCSCVLCFWPDRTASLRSSLSWLDKAGRDTRTFLF